MKNRGIDITLSILFTFVMVGASVALGLVSVMFAMMTDSCGPNSCNGTVIDVGVNLALWGNPLIALVMVIVTITSSARRRTAWYLPLVGVLLCGLVVTVGAMTIAFAVSGML